MIRASKGGGIWRPLLLALCALATVMCFAEVAAGSAWAVSRGSGIGTTALPLPATPYVIKIASADPIGATAQAGMRPGDRIDIRKLSFDDRIAFFLQPFGPRTYTIPVEREGRRHRPIHPIDDVRRQRAAKSLLAFGAVCAPIVALVCAWLIALQGSSRREGQLLCLVLLCFIFCNVGSSLCPAGGSGPLNRFSLIALGLCRSSRYSCSRLVTAKRRRSETSPLPSHWRLYFLAARLSGRSRRRHLGVHIDPVPLYYGLTSIGSRPLQCILARPGCDRRGFGAPRREGAHGLAPASGSARVCHH